MGVAGTAVDLHDVATAFYFSADAKLMPLGLVRAENNVGENMEVCKDKVGKVKKKKNLWNEGNRLLGKMETDELQEWRDETGLSHPVAWIATEYS